MTSFSKPTSELVNAAVAKLSAPQHERHFFDQLKNPLWIAPLKERGFFNTPPALVRVEGTGVRCPPWPQSRYLCRMAAIAPDEVATVLENLQTDNWIVAHDVVDAAKAMPAPIAVRLVDTIGAAMRHSMAGHLLRDVGELVAQLVSGGQPDAALRLAQLAFAIGDEGSPAPKRRLDEHLYFDSMREHVVPSLAGTRAREFIPLMLGWMANLLDGRDPAERDLDQTSFIWRPAIEEHDQNQDFSFAAKMVSSVRTACEVGIRAGNVSLQDVLAMMASSTGQVLARLRVHLIAEFADQDATLARDTMMDAALFKDSTTKHEYARLLGVRWPLLTPLEQQRWLSWVDAGPEGIREDYYDQPEDEARTAKQRDYWQFQRLHWVRAHLVGDRRDFYDQMLKEHGEPELADLNVFHGGVRYGHDSPMSADSLAAMGFRKAVEAVASWRPDPTKRSFDEPDVEGLAQEFQQFVGRDPSAVSKEAAAMQGSRPIFVRSFLQAMESAVKEGKDVDLRAVLALAKWVIDRPPTEAEPTRDAGRLVDRDWQWCRDTIASLIEEVGKARDAAGSARFDLSYRSELWEVARVLPSCPATEYVVRDESEDPREVDWPLVLLNSTRGKAMRAVLAYADWVASNLAPGDRSRTSIPGGLDSMPEVREVLESELARPDADSAGRAAFGWRLGLLFWIDSSWVKANAVRIFDLRALEGDRAHAFGWAAWSAFLFVHRPHIEFYKLLRDQFAYAVDQSSRVSGDNRREKIWSRLGEHLMVLFGRGDLGAAGDDAIAADGGIIRRLVTTTHVSVRSHAVQFVGSSLSGSDQALPGEVISRFQTLWERYWDGVGRSDAAVTPQSAVFGYWFSSGAFDPRWSIERLHAFVTAAPRAEPDDMIVEQLAKICQNDPLRSAQVMQLLVQGDTEGWRISGWKAEAKQVLSVAIAAGGEARGVAEQVVDRLGRRGFLEFGELLRVKA
jgi:hypothetical protein